MTSQSVVLLPLFLGLLLAGCGGGKKTFLLDEMKVTLKPPSGWAEEYKKEWGLLKYVKSKETELTLRSYCLNCPRDLYESQIEKKIDVRVAYLSNYMRTQLKLKETIQPGIHLYLIEGESGDKSRKEFIVGAHHVAEGIKGILSCEGKLGKEDAGLVEEIKKICKNLKITTKG